MGHPGWVRGASVHAPGDVVPFLCEGAQHRARRALRMYKSSSPWETLDAATDAGGAVELLAKACVALVEPALLAKGGNGLAPAVSVLHLRGHDRVLESVKETRLVTLDAAVALGVAVDLFPKLRTVSAGARTALEARNDALHMGIADPDVVDAAVAGMAKFVGVALPLLGLRSEEFWGDDELSAAGDAVDTRAGHVAEVAEAKIELAGKRYARLLLPLGDVEAAKVIAALQSAQQERLAGRAGFPERCPACENFGWVDVGADFDVEHDDGGWNYYQTDQWVDGFECPVCHLKLDAEECAELGIGAVEPDEDDPRDR